jgi:ABC-type Fe3+-siderophore transport system permease subunit
MKRLLRASSSAGYAASLVPLLLGIVNAFTTTPQVVLGQIMWGMLFFWFLGFLFSFLLLIPLIFVFNRGSKEFSLLLFVLVGFSIPALFCLLISTHPALSQPQGLYRAIFFFGSAGVLSASAAWYSLRKAVTQPETETKRRKKGVGDKWES